MSTAEAVTPPVADPAVNTPGWWDRYTARAQEKIDQMHTAEVRWAAVRAITIVRLFDVDRTVEVVRKAKGLKRDPERIANELLRSSAGCDWLLARWEMLGDVLDENGVWTADEMSLAMDLLGVASELRKGTRRGLPVGREQQRALVRAQVEDLNFRKQNGLDTLAAEAKAAAISGILVPPDDAIRRIKAERNAAERSLRLGLRQRDKMIKAERATQNPKATGQKAPTDSSEPAKASPVSAPRAKSPEPSSTSSDSTVVSQSQVGDELESETDLISDSETGAMDDEFEEGDDVWIASESEITAPRSSQSM